MQQTEVHEVLSQRLTAAAPNHLSENMVQDVLFRVLIT